MKNTSTYIESAGRTGLGIFAEGKLIDILFTSTSMAIRRIRRQIRI
ncbi:MAG: hypothetical protein KF860_07695 [Cyclobacteriaceae bacterium]|nr:hypothetical protein [Cyclobacteriaceae bacterium]